MRTLVLLAAAGAYAYATTMDRKTKKHWKKRIAPMSISAFENVIPSKRTMKRMGKQWKKTFA